MALTRGKRTQLVTLLIVALGLPVCVQAGALEIQGLAVGTDITDRTPQGVNGQFDPTVGKLYAFTRVVGAEAPTRVHHRWYWDGQLMADVELTVRSSSWRTWSSKNIAPHWVGTWTVEIVSAEGVILDTIRFSVG